MALLAFIAAVFWNRPRIRQAPGGTYSGSIPEFGEFKLHLFLAERPHAWLYREGVGLPLKDYGPHFDSDNRLRLELQGPRKTWSWETNTFLLSWQPSRAWARRVEAIFIRHDGERTPFSLTLEHTHAVIKRQAGLVVASHGARNQFVGEFPVLGATSVFTANLGRWITAELNASATDFTADGFQRNWNALRDGLTRNMCCWRDDEQWQLRLKTDRLVSLAVWTSPDGAGNGNWTRWLGKNYWWDGKLVRALTLPELFRADSRWEEYVRHFCARQLRQQGAIGAEYVIERDTIAIDVFTMSPTGIQIYFNPYNVGSGGDGEFVVHVPYEFVRDFLDLKGPARLLPLPKGSQTPAEAKASVLLESRQTGRQELGP